MAGGEERLKVLQMLEDGKITAEDAATLLRALDGGRGPGREQAAGPIAGRFLRVHVTDLVTSRHGHSIMKQPSQDPLEGSPHRFAPNGRDELPHGDLIADLGNTLDGTRGRGA